MKWACFETTDLYERIMVETALDFGEIFAISSFFWVVVALLMVEALLLEETLHCNVSAIPSPMGSKLNMMIPF